MAPKLFRARPKSKLVVFAFHNLGPPHSYLPRAPRSLNPPLSTVHFKYSALAYSYEINVVQYVLGIYLSNGSANHPLFLRFKTSLDVASFPGGVKEKKDKRNGVWQLYAFEVQKSPHPKSYEKKKGTEYLQ